MDTDKLHPYGQSVEFYEHKWISRLTRYGNELLNPNQNPKLKESICNLKICPINGIPETDRHAALAKIQSLCTIFSKPPNQENKLII